MVTVKFFAGLREAVDSSRLDISGGSVEAVLERLMDKNHELKELIFKDYENKELKDNIILMVNGRAIQHLEGLETPLKEGDTLSVFPTVAGG